MHDVGKVAIPDSILHKPGKLDAQEWAIMQKHVEYGVEILNRSKRRLMQVAKEIAATHHEKWDGSGYPNRLQGDDIPISGRITAIADVFDALGAKRSYKDPWTDEQIREELMAQKGVTLSRNWLSYYSNTGMSLLLSVLRCLTRTATKVNTGRNEYRWSARRG